MENKETKLPVYRLQVNECTEDFCDSTETNMISLVDVPAIGVDFISFGTNSSIKKQTFKIQDTSKRCLIGPLMIPNLEIYRTEKDDMGNITKEYNIIFTEEDVVNAQKNFIKKNYSHNINLSHSTDIDNAFLLENWIITDPKNDKSSAYNFKGLAKGTWMGVVYLPNDQVWESYIKTGQLKGFSVEGLYSMSARPIETFSKEIGLNKEEMNLIDKLTQLLSEEDIDLSNKL